MKLFVFVFSLLVAFTSVAQPAWQQRVDTRINVKLDDNNHFLHANEEFVYTNNSPDTLRYLYIHLWPNAYKNDRTPLARQLDVAGNTNFYYAKAADRGYIDSLQFTVDGQNAEYYTTASAPDIARLELPKPLLPGERITVATPFRVKIPIVFSRLGHSGQAYYITQWFPKPAVYDQSGWHPISYMDQGEFYSEYGSYDVAITLPENYVTMATGNCQDEEENRTLDEMARRPLPNDTLYIAGTPVSSAKMKTVHYHEDNVHDFAWFADKRWIVRKDTVYCPGQEEPITAWAAFLPSYQTIWKNAIAYLKETVKHYGKWVGPYTYKTIKAVSGDMKAGGGMEYPTITIIDKSASASFKTVVIHEAGHNWFYGLLGSNERDHPWMDEGMNTFYEQKTSRELISDTVRVLKKGFNETTIYYELAATHNDQALEQPATNFSKLNYGIDVYYKTAAMLKWLERYMGSDNFQQGMHDYYETWHFHHPFPKDFRVCMQRHTSKSLDWFFDTILHTEKKIDFTITHASVNGSNTEVTVRNNSGVFSPALIEAYCDSSLITSGWTEPFAGVTTITLPSASWTRLKISDDIADAKSTNDLYRRNALFHHFGIKVKPFVGLNMGYKDKVFIAPALGDNLYDGFMLGALFHDLTIPDNRFRFAVAPMYSFATNTLVGTGSVGYIWYPENLFKEVMIQTDVKSFHYNETLINLSKPLYARYVKIAPSLIFTFNEHNKLSPVTRTLTLKEYNIAEDNIFFADSMSKPKLVTAHNTYGLIRYEHNNGRTYNPFSYMLEGHGNGDFAKLSADGRIRIDYDTKSKSLYVRGFFGKYFALNNDPAIVSRYELNSSYSGIDDYLYDGTFKGRYARNHVSAQQISLEEGGFKIPVFNNVDRSDNWMAALNLETDLPKISIPVRLFFDAGLIPNAHPDLKRPTNTSFLYDGGIEVYILKDIINVYFPIIMSSNYQNYLTNTFGRKNVFARSISFTLEFQNINWLKTPTKALKAVVN